MSRSAQDLFDTAPLGAIVRFSDGRPPPPASFAQRRRAWEINNGVGRLVRKIPGSARPGSSCRGAFASACG